MIMAANKLMDSAYEKAKKNWWLSLSDEQKQEVRNKIDNICAKKNEEREQYNREAMLQYNTEMDKYDNYPWYIKLFCFEPERPKLFTMYGYGEEWDSNWHSILEKHALELGFDYTKWV